MKKLYSATKKFLCEEEGVTAIEYALIAALIAVAVIATVSAVGSQLNTVFTKIKDCLSGGVGSGTCTT